MCTLPPLQVKTILARGVGVKEWGRVSGSRGDWDGVDGRDGRGGWAETLSPSVFSRAPRPQKVELAFIGFPTKFLFFLTKQSLKMLFDGPLCLLKMPNLDRQFIG